MGEIQDLWDEGDPQAPQGFKDWGDEVTSRLQPTGRRAGRTTDLSISSGSTTQLPINNVDAAYGPGSTDTSNTYKAGREGVYRLSAGIRWESNSTGYRRLRINVNGGVVAGQVIEVDSGANVGYQTVSTEYPLEVDDEVTVDVLQTSGGSLDVRGNPATFFSCWMLTGTDTLP